MQIHYNCLTEKNRKFTCQNRMRTQHFLVQSVILFDERNVFESLVVGSIHRDMLQHLLVQQES